MSSCICSGVDHRRCQNAVRRSQRHTRLLPCVQHFCSCYILMLFYYVTDAGFLYLSLICSQKQSDEFRLYVYKQLDIQELLELDGVCFMMLYGGYNQCTCGVLTVSSDWI